ncbi:MAG TPA: hypothetical protein VF175_11495 [Lacipirellula sp.]
MQESVITLLLAAHLLAMNVASAGPLIGACLSGRREDGRRLSLGVYRLSLLSLLAGGLIGLGLLLWPSEGMRAALERFPADTYWYAGIELAFSAACMAGLIAGGEWLARRRLASVALAVLTAMNLLYHFPPLMAVLGELAADATWTREQVIDRAALLRLWRRPEILALWAHFVLASFAVAPIAALWRAYMPKGRAKEDVAGRQARWLGGVALVATLSQLPVGLWLLSTGSGSEQRAIMGGDLVAMLCFAGSMLAVPWLLHTLVAVTLGEGRRAVVRAGYLLMAITILMTATLRQSRGASGADAPLTAPASISVLEPALITQPFSPPAPSSILRGLRRGACSL